MNLGSYNSNVVMSDEVWVFLLGNPNLEGHISDIWMIIVNWSGTAKYTKRPNQSLWPIWYDIVQRIRGPKN